MLRRFILALSILLICSCAGVKQISPEDLKNIDELQRTKAVLFFRAVPKDDRYYASGLGILRGALRPDGNVHHRLFIDDGFYAHVESDGEYFVIIIDPQKDNESLYINYINQKNKSEINNNLIGTSYNAGCDEETDLENIRFSINSPGIYDLGIINYEDIKIPYYRDKFKYIHSYNEQLLHQYIERKYPKLSNLPVTKIEPKKFINYEDCPTPYKIKL